MRRFKIIAALVLLAAVGIAKAQDSVSKYPHGKFGELDSKSASDVAPLDSSDYNDREAAVFGNNKNITISASFSSAGANAVVGIVPGHMVGTTFIPERSTPCDWATLTASSTFTVGGRYISRKVAFDTANYECCKVFLISVSAGNVIIGWSVH